MALIYDPSNLKLLKVGAPRYNVHLDGRGWDHDIHPRFHHLDDLVDKVWEELQALIDAVDAINVDITPGGNIYTIDGTIEGENRTVTGVGGSNLTFTDFNDLMVSAMNDLILHSVTRILLKTPGVNTGNASVGQYAKLIDTDGAIEFGTPPDTSVYNLSSSLTSTRIVNVANFDFSVYDTSTTVSSGTAIRMHNHRIRALANDIQIGYYQAASGVAKAGLLQFFPLDNTNGGAGSASLSRAAGPTGTLLLKETAGELHLQAANAGASNKIILRQDGEVEFNMYGLGNFTADTPVYRLAVNTDGSVMEMPLAEHIRINVSDETTNLTTGNAKYTFRMPYAFKVTAMRISCNTAPVGSDIIVDVNNSGTTMLSTKLHIDNGEKTSVTAATSYAMATTALADDEEITVDIDQIGSGTPGTGLKLTILGYRT